MYSYINMEEDGRMKRIAVVSDIHANKYALNAFLEYINKEKINTILNLGDFVQIGPNPAEATKTILNDSRFINILGNNETSLFNISENNNSEEIKHRRWTKEQIKNQFELVKKIPTEKILKIENEKILMIHSRKNDIESMPLIYTENLDNFVDDYKEFETDIILLGHTHEKMYVEYNGKFIINPGSLGCSRTLSADFVILKLENRKIIVCTFKSIEYDRKELLNDFEKQDVPDKELFEKEFFKLV